MSATARIYNIWRQVLEYFDAFLIGLTATPTTQTIGFFGGNLVQDYTHEQAVVDGVNVGYDVYRIETKITRDGAKLVREPGVFVPHRDRRTKGKKYQELDDDLTYTANQLDRDVVAENQIRLVIRTFKEKLPEIFPGRTEVPKTLVFAKTDLHAEDIVRIIREEFGKGNDFCQKITSKTTGKKPDELLSEFRNSYFPASPSPWIYHRRWSTDLTVKQHFVGPYRSDDDDAASNGEADRRRTMCPARLITLLLVTRWLDL